MTATELREMLVTMLAGATDQPVEHWETVIGAVGQVPMAFSTASNWKVMIVGSEADRDAAETAIALVRAEHPYVNG